MSGTKHVYRSVGSLFATVDAGQLGEGEYLVGLQFPRRQFRSPRDVETKYMTLQAAKSLIVNLHITLTQAAEHQKGGE